MVRRKVERSSTVRSTYYLKPGQTLENTKPSQRALALIVPKSIYDGFYEKINEKERVALLAEREIKRLAALKEATYNMSKNWQDTAQNIQKRRREELLNRRKIEEAERIKFSKEMAIKNAEERAKVVKQAKELILYRKPQCRLINRALLASETYKQLNEQIKLRKISSENQEKIRAEEARLINEDVEKFHEEERKKREEHLKKLKLYKNELEKQIQNNAKNLRDIEESIRKSETEDLKNMTKEMEEIKKKELNQMLEKKEKLKNMFLAAIEEKKEHELKIKQAEEFQEKSLKIYKDFKVEVNKKLNAARKEKILKTKLLNNKYKTTAVEKCLTTEEKNKKEEEEIEEKNKKELLEIKEKEKQRKEKTRLEMQQQMQALEEELKLRKKEEMDLKLYEFLQRYKRDEFDKKWNLEQLEKEKDKKLNYAKILKEQMEENEVKRKKELIEEDDSKIIKEMIDNNNKKVLAYGEKILQESQGVRPLYPIIKAIEEFKREAGLVVPSKTEENYEVNSIPKKIRGRRIFCKTAKENN